MTMRDQQRALHAYKAVAEVHQPGQTEALRDYRIAVNNLGANILRSGLCAALAAVMRKKGAGQVVLKHLASAKLPGLEGVSGSALPQKVADLPASKYMLVTREAVQVATWLKRAAQAADPSEQGAD